MRMNEIDNAVTQIQINALEKALDKVFAQVGIDVEFTRHFLDRVNDERNVKQITLSELGQLFKKEFIKFGKPIAQLGPDQQAVMKDLSSDINLPFALEWNPKTGMLELIAKTVMRKKNFATSNKEFAVESLIMEGGAMPGVGAIHIDEINATLDELEKSLGIDLKNNVLGSVGKRPFSGDIDVAINLPAEEIPSFVEKLKKNPLVLDIAKSSVIMTKVKIVGFDSEKTDGRPRTGYVQVDFMPGDPGWMKTFYHSPSQDESKYKGVFRNIMISIMAAAHNRIDSDAKLEDGRPMESTRYLWSPTDGLVRVKRTPVPNKAGTGYTKKNQNDRIDGPWKQADDIAKVLGLDSGKDLNSFESLFTAMNKNWTKESAQTVIQGFKDNHIVKDIGVPEELG